MRNVAIVLGVICLLAAVMYWVIPAGSLPSFVPGYEAGSAVTHVKHGIAAAVVGVALLGIGWFRR